MLYIIKRLCWQKARRSEIKMASQVGASGGWGVSVPKPQTNSRWPSGRRLGRVQIWGTQSVSTHKTKQNRTSGTNETRQKGAARKLKVACHWTMNWSPAIIHSLSQSLTLPVSHSLTHSPSHSLCELEKPPSDGRRNQVGGGMGGRKKASRVCESRVFAYAKDQTKGPGYIVWRKDKRGRGCLIYTRRKCYSLLTCMIMSMSTIYSLTFTSL